MLTRSLVLLSLLLCLVFGAGVSSAQEATEEPAAAETVATAPAPSGLVVGVWHLHSLVRWVVVLITVLLLVKLVSGLLRGREFDALAQRLMMMFTMSLSLQWVLGILLLVVLGSFNVRYRWEHAGIMTLALALAHMGRRFGGSTDASRYRNSLIIVVLVVLLVYLGVVLLPQGWRVAPTL